MPDCALFQSIPRGEPKVCDDVCALARGYGGQIICVVPGLELTVAITSDPTRPARSAGYFGDLLQLIERGIIPTARRKAA